MPMGGQTHSSFEVRVTGQHVEHATKLWFSHPEISSVPKTGPDGSITPSVFVVSVGKNVPPGAYEAALVAPAGLSSTRIFTVSNLKEITHPGGDDILDITPDTIANGVVQSQHIDQYRIKATLNQSLFIQCAAAGIDSRMHPVVIVSDSAGRDLAVERRGGMIKFIPPSDGTFFIRIHDLCYRGGAAFFYRLMVTEAKQHLTPTRHPLAAQVSSFSWPPAQCPTTAPRTEAETNGTNFEKIVLPCDISGRFFPAADVDGFEFEAEAGETWWVELASQRLGCPTAPAASVVRVVESTGDEGHGDSRQVLDLIQLPEIPAPIKPSSNAYSYDGPPYNAGSSDLLGKLAIEHTGTYRIALRDRFGGTRNEPNSHYRMIIRKACPDFALVGWGLHMELRNGDRNDLSKPFALRRGATIAIEIAVFRRDGFDGPIDLSVDGLPAGISAQGIQIPEKDTRGLLFLTAETDAVVPPTRLQIMGRAVIEENNVQHRCHIASVAWPVRNHAQEVPLTRLVTDPHVSVSSIEHAPLILSAGRINTSTGCSEIQATENTTIKIPLSIVKNAEFSGDLIRLKAFGNGFTSFPVMEVPLSNEQADITLDLNDLNIPPGRHMIAFYTTAIVKYVSPQKTDSHKKEMPVVKPVDTAEIVISRPLSLHVLPTVEQAKVNSTTSEKS